METNRKPSQVQKVLAYMKRHKYITQHDAYIYLGISRLGARIWEIEHKLKMTVDREFIWVKNRDGEECQVKRYWLAEEQAV